jgi:hypothetical protein
VLARLRPHLTYANVVSTLCLFIVLGGSSYAAVTLKRNSVRSKHIKNGQVKRPDVARNAIDSSKVRDGSLLGQDFAAGQLPVGATGQQGPPGPQGPAGSALAFAHVASNGDVDESQSKNVSDAMVAAGGNGRYCFDLPFPVAGAVGNIDELASTPGEVSVTVAPPPAECGGQAKDVFVRTRQLNGTGTDQAFYIVFN